MTGEDWLFGSGNTLKSVLTCVPNWVQGHGTTQVNEVCVYLCFNR